MYREWHILSRPKYIEVDFIDLTTSHQRIILSLYLYHDYIDPFSSCVSV